MQQSAERHHRHRRYAYGAFWYFLKIKRPVLCAKLRKTGRFSYMYGILAGKYMYQQFGLDKLNILYLCKI